MDFFSASNLHRAASILYALLAPGHVIYGFRIGYSALQSTPTEKAITRAGKNAGYLCFSFVTTAFLAQAIMHWKWSRTGIQDSREEMLAGLGLTAHVLWIGIQNTRAGAVPAGPLIIATAATGIAAFLADLRS